MRTVNELVLAIDLFLDQTNTVLLRNAFVDHLLQLLLLNCFDVEPVFLLLLSDLRAFFEVLTPVLLS
jgi:hypothetical protein